MEARFRSVCSHPAGNRVGLQLPWECNLDPQIDPSRNLKMRAGCPETVLFGTMPDVIGTSRSSAASGHWTCMACLFFRNNRTSMNAVDDSAVRISHAIRQAVLFGAIHSKADEIVCYVAR